MSNRNLTMPDIGMGTFRLEGEIAQQSVELAMQAGYRHIDTAQIYQNEAEVGAALDNCGIAREEIFVTTKVWNSNLNERRFLSSVEESLMKLKTHYVDLLLIHWPAPDSRAAMQAYLSALLQAKEQKLARYIGVSNFTIANLKTAFEIIPVQDIYTNQIEVHPYLTNEIVLQFCQEHDIAVTGYMPFAVGKALKDKTIMAIAAKYQVQTAQVLVAWQLAKGINTIPSSTKREHLTTNLAGQSLVLTNEDIRQIDGLNCGERIANPEFSPHWD